MTWPRLAVARVLGGYQHLDRFALVHVNRSAAPRPVSLTLRVIFMPWSPRPSSVDHRLLLREVAVALGLEVGVFDLA
jgi:hypothetical protein